MHDQAQRAMGLFHALFGMELQLEQWGPELDFVGARLCDIHGPDLISKKLVRGFGVPPPSVHTTNDCPLLPPNA